MLERTEMENIKKEKLGGFYFTDVSKHKENILNKLYTVALNTVRCCEIIVTCQKKLPYCISTKSW